MKITLKTVILVALFIFYLVIILSNFTTYEGMETKSPADETNEDEIDATEPMNDKSESTTNTKKPVSKNDVKTNLVKTVLKPEKKSKETETEPDTDKEEK